MERKVAITKDDAELLILKTIGELRLKINELIKTIKMNEERIFKQKKHISNIRKEKKILVKEIDKKMVLKKELTLQNDSLIKEIGRLERQKKEFSDLEESITYLKEINANYTKELASYEKALETFKAYESDIDNRQVIKLNVNGKKYTIGLKTLTSKSKFFEAMFSGDWKEKIDDEYFFDFSPLLFDWFLFYSQHDTLPPNYTPILQEKFKELLDYLIVDIDIDTLLKKEIDIIEKTMRKHIKDSGHTIYFKTPSSVNSNNTYLGNPYYTDMYKFYNEKIELYKIIINYTLLLNFSISIINFIL